VSGPPQLNNRRERRNAAREVAKQIMHSGKRKLPMSELAWSWPVVGAVLFFVWGGAIAFMTSTHPNLADSFFIAGSALFIAKFLSWEDAKKHGKRGAITALTMTAIATITIGALWGNHRINRVPEPEYKTVVDRHLTMGRLTVSGLHLSEFNS
jgi:hypothetical protein